MFHTRRQVSSGQPKYSAYPLPPVTQAEDWNLLVNFGVGPHNLIPGKLTASRGNLPIVNGTRPPLGASGQSSIGLMPAVGTNNTIYYELTEAMSVNAQWTLVLRVEDFAPTSTQRGLFQLASSQASGTPGIMLASETTNGVRLYVQGNYRITDAEAVVAGRSHTWVIVNDGTAVTMYRDGKTIGTYGSATNSGADVRAWPGHGFGGNCGGVYPLFGFAYYAVSAARAISISADPWSLVRVPLPTRSIAAAQATTEGIEWSNVPWFKQPQVAAPLAPRFRNAILAILPSIRRDGDYRGLSITTESGLLNRRDGPAGRSINQPDGGAHTLTVTPPFASGALTEATLLVVQQHPVGTTGNKGWHRINSNGAEYEHWTYGGGLYLSTFSLGRWVSGTADPMTIGKVHAVAIVAKGTSRKLFVDGKTVVSTTGASTVQWNYFFVGQDDGSFVAHMNTYLMIVLPWAMSDSECAELNTPEKIFGAVFAPVRRSFALSAAAMSPPYHVRRIPWLSQPQFPVPIDRSSPLAARILHYWHFHPSTGLHDLVGTAHGAGTNLEYQTAAGSITARYNAAKTTYINVGDPDDLDLGSADFTLVVRAQLDSMDAGRQMLLGKDSGSGRQFHFQIGQSSTGDIDMTINTTSVAKSSGGVVQAGKMHHFAFTRVNGTCNVYVDGVNVTNTSSNQTVPSTTTNLLIGAREYGGAEDRANGYFEQVIIAARGWSATEVAMHAARPWSLMMPVTQRRFFGEASAAPQTFFQTLEAALSGTVSFVRSIAMVRSASSAAGATLAKLGAFLSSLSASSAVSATIDRAATFLRSLTATAISATGDLTKEFAVGRLLTAAVAGSATFARTVNKALSVPIAATATMIRLLATTLSASAGVSATLAKAIIKALEVTITSAATLAGTAARLASLTVTVTIATVVDRVRALFATLAASTSPVATIDQVKGVFRSLSASVSATASQLRQVQLVRVASATADAMLERVGSLSRILTATVSTSASIARRLARTITASATIVPAVIRVVPKRITAASVVVARRLRTVLRTQAASIGSSATVTRSADFLRTLTATVGAAASVVALRILQRAIDAQAGVTATRNFVIGRVMAATAGLVATRQWFVTKTLRAGQATSATMRRTRFRLLEVVVNVTALFSWGAAAVGQLAMRIRLRLATAFSNVSARGATDADLRAGPSVDGQKEVRDE